MKKIDGKECNTAKGVSITTEFNKVFYLIKNCQTQNEKNSKQKA